MQVSKGETAVEPAIGAARTQLHVWYSAMLFGACLGACRKIHVDCCEATIEIASFDLIMCASGRHYRFLNVSALRDVESTY